MNRLIEQSSLGTREAKQLRASVPAATGREIVRAAAARSRAAKAAGSGNWKKKSK
ncbi:hypothetical protein ACFYTF_28980 [Nocardia thailandica]|uniref:50S ribosomal protein L22 n=1 Tax=Nocardia thailandica TaxID=257275 RepID=A0ABW6PWZ2_9NOCA